MCQHTKTFSNAHSSSAAPSTTPTSTPTPTTTISSYRTQQKTNSNSQCTRNKQSMGDFSKNDMDDMFSECNKNNIYVSNTSYRYGEIDMINLFGSPAGRAINEITSIKLNKSEQKNKQSTNGQSSTIDSLNVMHIENNVSSLVERQSLATKLTTTTTASSRRPTNKSGKYFNTNSNFHAKKVKYLNYLEQDKVNVGNSNNHKAARNDLSDSIDRIKQTTRNVCKWWPRKTNRKSSSELYREAVQILGLSCTLSNNCRCLDCQSRYFEFDDSDSYSEKSFFGDEIDLFGDDDNYFDVDDDDNIYDYYNENYFTKLNNQKCWTEKTSNSVSASLSDLSIESERDSTQT